VDPVAHCIGQEAIVTVNAKQLGFFSIPDVYRQFFVPARPDSRAGFMPAISLPYLPWSIS
jgi:hypothetical protein